MTIRNDILGKLSEIVAIPSCAHKAAAMLDDPDADFDELARLIEFDPGLTANLLKVVNASFFSSKRPILTASEAIGKLGDTQMLQFVISTGVAPTFVQKVEGYDLSPLDHLQHSVTVALLSQELGNVLGIDYPDYTFTAGLLAGIGKIVLGHYVAVNVQPMLDLAGSKGLSFDQAEDEVLGINHAEVAGILLDSWGLPKPLVDVVRHHLRPDEFEGRDVALDLVHFGNVMAKMVGVGLGVDGLNYIPSQKVAERLGLGPEHLDLTSANVVFELQSVRDIYMECVL